MQLKITLLLAIVVFCEVLPKITFPVVEVPIFKAPVKIDEGIEPADKLFIVTDDPFIVVDCEATPKVTVPLDEVPIFTAPVKIDEGIDPAVKLLIVTDEPFIVVVCVDKPKVTAALADVAKLEVFSK